MSGMICCCGSHHSLVHPLSMIINNKGEFSLLTTDDKNKVREVWRRVDQGKLAQTLNAMLIRERPKTVELFYSNPPKKKRSIMQKRRKRGSGNQERQSSAIPTVNMEKSEKPLISMVDCDQQKELGTIKNVTARISNTHAENAPACNMSISSDKESSHGSLKSTHGRRHSSSKVKKSSSKCHSLEPIEPAVMNSATSFKSVMSIPSIVYLLKTKNRLLRTKHSEEGDPSKQKSNRKSLIAEGTDNPRFYHHTVEVINVLDKLIKSLRDNRIFVKKLCEMNTKHLELKDIQKSLFKDFSMMIDQALADILVDQYVGSGQLAMKKLLDVINHRLTFCMT